MKQSLRHEDHFNMEIKPPILSGALCQDQGKLHPKIAQSRFRVLAHLRKHGLAHLRKLALTCDLFL